MSDGWGIQVDPGLKAEWYEGLIQEAEASCSFRNLDLKGHACFVRYWLPIVAKSRCGF